MIVEVGNYRIKAGTPRVIKFFETQAIPAQQRHGMTIVGPLINIENPMINIENPNKFVWLRAFRLWRNRG